MGCAGQDAACLRAVPVATLLANQSLSPSAYMPNVDGKVLTQSVGAAFSSGQFNRVPVIEGSNHDEFRLFVAYLFELPYGPVTAAEYPGYIAALLSAPAQVVSLVMAQYPLSNYASPGIALGAIGTDAVFACNTLAVQHSLSQYVPTWAYEFDDANAPQRFLPPASFPYGAYHSAELQYLFDLPVTVPAPALTADQERLSSAMVAYWSDFARQSRPEFVRDAALGSADVGDEPHREALLPPTPQASTRYGFRGRPQLRLLGRARRALSVGPIRPRRRPRRGSTRRTGPRTWGNPPVESTWERRRGGRRSQCTPRQLRRSRSNRE